MSKLLYTKGECERYITAFGFVYMRGLEQYENTVLRNRIVLRVKLAKVICAKYYLSAENVDEYSDVLFNHLTGLLYDTVRTPELLKMFYANDVKFRRYMANLYYVKFMTAEDNCAFLSIIIQDLKDHVLEEIINFKSTTEGSYGVLYDGETGTDIYLAVDEAISQTISVDEKYKLEVISSAKNWVGRVQGRN